MTLQRQLKTALAALLATLMTMGATSYASAQPDSGAIQTATSSLQGPDEQAFVKALNETRSELGLPALTVHLGLADLSHGHAVVMADADDFFHATLISAGLDAPWLKLGENVGVGSEVDTLMEAFLASPTHYQNIADPAFTHVGVAVVWDGDTMFTTHRFMTLADVELSTPATTSLT